MMIVWIPLGIALLALIWQIIFRRVWDKGLSVRFSFEDHPATEGETTYLEEVVANRKRLSLHLLQVQFQLDRGLHVTGDTNASISDHSNCVEYFSLRACEQLTRRIEIDCVRRGFYRILRTTLLAPGILSSRQQIMHVPQDTSLYVFPKMIEAPDIAAAFERLLGEVLSRRYLYPDVFTFRGIREYAPTDPMSSINQKAFARCGNLMVNLRDYTAGQEVCLLLNLEKPAIRYDRDLPEEEIRLAYTLAARLIEARLPVAFRTNGRDGLAPEDVSENPENRDLSSLRGVFSGISSRGSLPSRNEALSGRAIRSLSSRNETSLEAYPGEISLASGSAKGHLTAIAEALARIDLERKVRAFDKIIDEILAAETPANVTYVLVSSARGDALREAAARLAARQNGLLWLAPLETDMPDIPMPQGIIFERIERKFHEA
ncbi:MAG: hypothetical protein ACSW75_02430 [Lachnospiraceae bacterium]